MHSGSSHYNYKGFHSTVLLAVCDYRYRFVMVDVGAEGRRSDGGIFRSSEIGANFHNKIFDIPNPEPLPNEYDEIGYFMVGDAAFPLTKYLMRPYPGQVLEDIDKAVFNYRLSRARRTIENSFGVMAARWRIFKTSIIAKLEVLCMT